MNASTIEYKNNQKHPFHLVDPSPWPLVASIGGLGMTFGGVMYMHNYSGGGTLFLTGFTTTIFVMYTWWKDIVREGTYEGQHTKQVQQGLRWGMILFIVSEVMFFFAFFWAFFHSSLAPTFDIGGVWPPEGIEVLNPWEVPLLNTVLLLSSGASVPATQHSTAAFSISDGLYGATYFMATGFHGFHVIIGTIFLTICTIRLVYHHFTREHHFGFEAAAWYWHFVDVVWLFLFVTIYWWGS